MLNTLTNKDDRNRLQTSKKTAEGFGNMEEGLPAGPVGPCSPYSLYASFLQAGCARYFVYNRFRFTPLVLYERLQ